jgi:hypothetical protein
VVGGTVTEFPRRYSGKLRETEAGLFVLSVSDPDDPKCEAGMLTNIHSSGI